MIRVRPAEPNDIPEIIRMANEFYDSTTISSLIPFDTTSAENVLTHPSVASLVATTQEGKVIGMYSVMITPYPFNMSMLVPNDLIWFVDKNYRKSGAASILKNEMFNICKENGIRVIMNGISTHPYSERVKKLLTRDGFFSVSETFAKEL